MANFEKIQEALINKYKAQSTLHMQNIGQSEMTVINHACSLTGVSKYVVFSKRRYDEIVKTRNMIIYRMKQLWGGSLNYYAKMMWLEKSDHTTVMNSLEVFRDDFQSDEAYRDRYNKLCELTKNLRPEFQVIQKKNADNKIKYEIPLQEVNKKIISASMVFTLEDGTKLEIEIKKYAGIQCTSGPEQN